MSREQEPASAPRTEVASAPRTEVGIFGVMCLLIGAGCLLVAAVSVVNVALDLQLSLSVYGTATKLPRSWDEVIGLAAIGGLFVGLTLFGGFVKRRFVAARGRPLVRAAIVVAACGSLALAGRGLQVLALINTYGSMLAYYATDGDLEDVRAELAKGPDPAALSEAVFRAGQYDNAAALELLLAAGADMQDSSRPEAVRRCALLGRSAAFVKVAVDRGVRPATCPRGETAIREAVSQGTDDEEVARTVTLLRAAGWSTTATPEYDRRTPAELARQKQWAATLRALE